MGLFSRMEVPEQPEGLQAPASEEREKSQTSTWAPHAVRLTRPGSAQTSEPRDDARAKRGLMRGKERGRCAG